MDVVSLVSHTWTNLVDSSQYNPLLIELSGVLLMQLVFFWLPSLIYISLPHISPRFSKAYKIQAPSHTATAVPELLNCTKVVLRNQALSHIFQAALHISFKHLGLNPPYRLSRDLPTPHEFLLDLTLSICICECIFYYSHRLLHHRTLYKRVHKTHHAFTAPIALSAQYSHPLEHLLSNILPLQIPGLLLNAHVVTWWVFLAMVFLESVVVHSGYRVCALVERHDLHHERFGVNFGTFWVLDWLHGTDARSGDQGRPRDEEPYCRGEVVVVGK